MKRCLCCGLPARAVLCAACARPAFLPWRYEFASRAWTSVALIASAAERRQQEHVFAP